MTDYWPDEEGAIFDAASVIFDMYPEGAITEGAWCKPGSTTTASRMQVQMAGASAFGDACWIALKSASSAGVPERIPILVYGPFKCTLVAGTADSVSAGSYVMNSGQLGIINTKKAGTNTASLILLGGTSYIAGLALQKAASDADEILEIGRAHV